MIQSKRIEDSRHTTDREAATYKLIVWRQPGPHAPGRLMPYTVSGVTPDMSLLETLDLLNISLVERGEEAIEFDSDCREGICGMCCLVINGVPHGRQGATSCILRMRHFSPEEPITIEPFRAAAFPVLKDLLIDRSALDTIVAAGGYISSSIGSAPPANTISIGKEQANKALDSASCIGCGACVAACPNASAQLYISAKISQYTYLPQGQIEGTTRAQALLNSQESLGFGHCSNYGECEAVCPQGLRFSQIATGRREYLRSLWEKITS